jgi:hypothetical protein
MEYRRKRRDRVRANKVVIACFRDDLFLLRPCVASIRYWYPEVEIYLLKDYIKGDFSTEEFEKCWNVKIFPAPRRVFGWGWSKLALILHEKKEKFLFLDSDVVLVGRVLDALNEYDEDFIVTGIREEDKQSHNVNAHYIDISGTEGFDPSYHYPGFAFNSGHFVITGGLLTEGDLSPVVDLGKSISNRYPHIFKHSDQGVLNYVLAKAHSEGRIRLRYSDFWIWPGMPAAGQITIESIKEKSGTPYVLHWAGAKPVDFRNYIRADLIEFFTDYYYSRVPLGAVKRKARFFRDLLIVKLKIAKYKLLRRPYE